MRPIERLFLQTEKPPFNCLYRMAVGFVLLPVYHWLLGRDSAFWPLFSFFIGALFLLRIVPAFVRHVFSFSRETQELWSKQRQLAKRYDSYQWGKLFWIGVGFAIYMTVSGNLHGLQLLLGVFCLIGGGVGIVFWRRINRTEELIRASRSSNAVQSEVR